MFSALCKWTPVNHQTSNTNLQGVCVCVCVKAPRNTVLMVFNQFQISKQGAGEGGGGVSGQRRHPPPPGANVPALPFFRCIAGAKLRTLSIFSRNYNNWAISPITNYFRTMLYFKWGLFHIDALPRTTPDNHVELPSVCVSPPGATSSRLDGPSEKVPVRKPQLMFPNGTREAIVPWIKGRTAGPLSHYSQSGTRI